MSVIMNNILNVQQDILMHGLIEGRYKNNNVFISYILSVSLNNFLNNFLKNLIPTSNFNSNGAVKNIKQSHVNVVVVGEVKYYCTDMMR